MSDCVNENNLATGWVRIYRSFFEDELHPLQEHRAFTKFEAKLDLLLLVRGTRQDRTIEGKLTTIERGSQMFSYSYLAQRWRWSIKKVRNFLGNLRTRGYLNLKSGKKGTLITIVNYNTYNPLPNSGAHNGTVKGTQRARKGQEYNKGNKGKKGSGDARIGEFLNWYSLEFEAVLGSPYIPSHGRDQRHIADLLTNLSPDELRRRAQAFLRDKDKFIAGTGRDIGIFTNQINRYIKSQASMEGLQVPEYEPTY